MVCRIPHKDCPVGVARWQPSGWDEKGGAGWHYCEGRSCCRESHASQVRKGKEKKFGIDAKMPNQPRTDRERGM